jgi:hypothetical protein
MTIGDLSVATHAFWLEWETARQEFLVWIIGLSLVVLAVVWRTDRFENRIARLEVKKEKDHA